MAILSSGSRFSLGSLITSTTSPDGITWLKVPVGYEIHYKNSRWPPRTYRYTDGTILTESSITVINQMVGGDGVEGGKQKGQKIDKLNVGYTLKKNSKIYVGLFL